MSDTLLPGLYDDLITESLADRIGNLQPDMCADIAELDPGDSYAQFARHASEAIQELLRLIELEGSERIAAQARAANAALRAAGDSAARSSLIREPARLLREIRSARPGTVPRVHPIVPLHSSALLVNDDQMLSAAAVLKREIASSDHVDLICAFVNFTGVRILEDEIRALCARGTMRLITTTYMGATQRRALDALAEWGVEIRVTYEKPPANTKLHAKAWLFSRNSGADTAMIGSSNLSHSALMDGLEWNVRLSRAETPEILNRFRSTFDRYWSDPTFEAYDPERDGERLDQMLTVCGGAATTVGPDFFLDVTPWPHQKDILEALDADRSRGHDRNLVVAATGTGKTIVAALDYKRQCKPGYRPTLLFVAHRAEILNQSLLTFRNVQRDGSFGEEWFRGQRPAEGRHVFASIQSLHEDALRLIQPDHFEYVIVDEFHHAEADTYQRLLGHIRPKLLLGLTATPERADGVNVCKFFGNRSTYEMRLWDALEDQLLCPFQYFGIADTVDLSSIPWRAGRYAPRELEDAYLARGADAAAHVLEHVQNIVTDWRQMRALAFCVGVRHAAYMHSEFQRQGVPSMVLTSNTPETERRVAISRLRERQLNVLFTVDLFNEGVDIPEADTLLFLRPTESATVFLQQLGRGLRLCENKPCTTVLDFVGQQNKHFRFDQRFRAVTGLSRSELERQVDTGFTSLPSGCHIQLDRVSRDHVLRNLREALPSKTTELVAEYRSLRGSRPDLPLSDYVRETGISLDDLYRTYRTYTSIKRQAGAITDGPTEDETRFSRGLVRLLHIVDEARLRSMADLLARPNVPQLETLRLRRQRELYMLLYTLASDMTIDDLQTMTNRLWECTHLRSELVELLTLLADKAPPGAFPLDAPGLADVPLCTHGVYSQNEIVTAFGLRNPSSMRGQGVHYFEDHRCDVFFITLKKTEMEYSPTTRYEDYPITPELFKWDSQNPTGADTKQGRRYINHAVEGSSVVLFVREEKTGESGTAPYFCCGPADYVSHESSRPMKIIWRLRVPLPHRWFQAFRAVSG